ncbi:hypothetical protein [Propionimicrobium lymphophilum]|uniref:hypothetical protein n=1 Tax=Propionimicrobium lymphophilum TaxID=33012 RepID=UPI0004224A66|nr:hypothetical protein [Propionimicrobium lymphophilum]
MQLIRLRNKAIGLYVQAKAPVRRDERGLSQSTENAVLLTGAVALAAAVIAIVGVYVKGKLATLGAEG